MSQISEEEQAYVGDLAQTQRALEMLATSQPDLAAVLADVLVVVAAEATRNPRFAKKLTGALFGAANRKPAAKGASDRRARREPGPWDPFTVYAEQGEQGLRERLASLELEQLRNIVAEHGMDSDRLAMKWRDSGRVINRIVERVVDRAAKGEGFRGQPTAYSSSD
ncbi:hypothetical protein ABZU53_11205 [Micromonospora sp. NPDC005194]|uniref:hypothetical protein n=1 Tax=Micromonospora sp. NPDC005194 TaxID=3156870 RepID=UPI0033AF7AF6